MLPLQPLCRVPDDRRQDRAGPCSTDLSGDVSVPSEINILNPRVTTYGARHPCGMPSHTRFGGAGPRKCATAAHLHLQETLNSRAPGYRSVVVQGTHPATYVFKQAASAALACGVFGPSPAVPAPLDSDSPSPGPTDGGGNGRTRRAREGNGPLIKQS